MHFPCILDSWLLVAVPAAVFSNALVRNLPMCGSRWRDNDFAKSEDSVTLGTDDECFESCPAGKSARKDRVCAPCLPGHHKAIEGKAECIACEVGFVAGQGQAECIEVKYYFSACHALLISFQRPTENKRRIGGLYVCSALPENLKRVTSFAWAFNIELTVVVSD